MKPAMRPFRRPHRKVTQAKGHTVQTPRPGFNPAAAAGFAFITTMGNFAGYTTPYLFGVLRDATGSFSAGFFGMATMPLIGAIAILLTPALRRCKAPVAGAPLAPEQA